MRPKKTERDQGELFRARLDQILNPSHPLYVLSNKINWEYFEEEFGSFYVEDKGRPGVPIRMIVGLHYLKHAFNPENAL